MPVQEMLSQLGITLLNNSLHERNNYRDKKGEASRDCLEDWRNTKVSSYDKAVYLIIGVCSRTFSRSFTSCPWTVVAFWQWLGEEEDDEEEEASFVLPYLPPLPFSLCCARRCRSPYRSSRPNMAVRRESSHSSSRPVR